MNHREKYKHAIACLTSMGVRIAPESHEGIHVSNRFSMQATSAETNVLNIASSLGMPCLALTRFVKESPIAGFIKRSLRARNIFCAGKDVPQEGPWGHRHQFNIADMGCGLRAPRVWNDRTGEVGQTISLEDFDLDEIFAREGVGIFHVSGLISALNENTGRVVLALVKKAREHGSLVSFDLNYRASFWKGREEELKKTFRAIASEADILTSIDAIEGTPEDFKPMSLEEKEAGLQRIIERAEKKYLRAKMFLINLRETIHAGEHRFGAMMRAEGTWYKVAPRNIPVVDRIGSGDGMVGGVLYGVLKGMPMEDCLKLGWAAGVLAAESRTDYAEPADEAQLWDIYGGNVLVQR